MKPAMSAVPAVNNVEGSGTALPTVITCEIPYRGNFRGIGQAVFQATQEVPASFCNVRSVELEPNVNCHATAECSLMAISLVERRMDL